MVEEKSKQPRWESFVSVIAIGLSMASLAVSVRSCSTTESSLKLHLQPQLVCVLDEHPNKAHFLLFSLKNEGPVPATNVTVDHVTLRYSKSEKKIRVGLPAGGSLLEYNPPGKRWIFKDLLKPNETLRKLTGESALRDSQKAVDVLIFDISYFRDTDGQAFQKRCSYYVDGDNVLTSNTFRSHPHYAEVINETARFLREEELEWSLTFPFCSLS